MRCSIVLLASCAIALQTTAQRPASPNQIDKAVDVLRRTPGVPPVPAAQPGVPLKIVTPSNAAPVAPANAETELSGQNEERARAMLRKLMADQQPATSSAPAVVSQKPASSSPTAKPAPATPQRTPPVATPPAQVVDADAVATPQLSPEAEQSARELLRTVAVGQQPGTNVPAAPAVRPAPPSVTTQVSTPVAPAPAVPPPQVVQTPPAQAPVAAPADDPIARAKNREAIRQKALAEARRIAEQQRATERPSPALSAEQERRAIADAERQRELQRIEMEVEKARRERDPRTTSQVAQPTPAPAQPVPAPTQPKPQQPVAAPVPGTTTSPARYPGLSSNMEQRARDILNQVIANTENAKLPTLATAPAKTTPAPAPAATVPPQAAPVAPIPAPAPVAARPAAPTVATAPAPAAVELPGDKEAEARRLLEQTLSSLPATPAKTAPEAPKPTQPTPMIAPAPKPAVTATTQPAAELPSDKEIQARQLLEKTLTNLPAPEDPEAKLEAKEQAKRELRAKADAEAKARREVERLEEESRSRAREIARQRLEGGKTQASAAPQTQPVAAKPQIQTAVAKPASVKVTPAVAKTPPPAERPAKKSGKDQPIKTPFVDNPSATKEQRLADALAAYQRDEINAEQYHTLRRKIISQ